MSDKMDEKTLEALKGSIKKWENIVAGAALDLGVENCPLCQLFHRETGSSGGDYWVACFGCPVAEHAGKPFCANTPHEEVGEMSDMDGTLRPGVTREEYTKEAQKELDFLKSLLPSEETKR